MDSLYQEHILDHYKHPRNRRMMEHADVVQKGHNASCGDDLSLYLKWDGDTLADVSFEGFGCAISQSGASMLTEKIKGKDRKEVEKISESQMYELYGADIGPSREKCGMLALGTLQAALKKDK